MNVATEILLVDDNSGDTELTAELLTRNNQLIHAHSVGDGVEAMAFLHCKGKYSCALRPDLILLDLNMPRKDGWAVLVDVKSDSALKEIPIVVFSSSDSGVDIARCYKLGANSYISKPGTLDRYKTTIVAIEEYWLSFASLVR